MKQADWKPPMMRELTQQFNFPPHPFPIFPLLTSGTWSFFLFFNLSFNPPQIDGLALSRQSINTCRIKTGDGFYCGVGRRNLTAAPRERRGGGASGGDDRKEGEDEWVSLEQPEAEVSSNCDKMAKGQRSFRVAAPVCKIQGAPRGSAPLKVPKQNWKGTLKLNHTLIYLRSTGEKFGITLWTECLFSSSHDYWLLKATKHTWNHAVNNTSVNSLKHRFKFFKLATFYNTRLELFNVFLCRIITYISLLYLCSV